jgi:hypothetical protein
VTTPRIFFLGAPKIEINGKPIELNSAKAIALLAYLVVQRESVTHTEARLKGSEPEKLVEWAKKIRVQLNRPGKS